MPRRPRRGLLHVHEQAIRDLHALGVMLVMLTGSNPTTARPVADQVGINDARGSLFPEDKLAAIDELLASYGQVGMVGDGINDAPVLAKASICFAMGAAGTDTAIETVDVAFMDDDLRKLPRLITLSRGALYVLKQNITLSLGTPSSSFPASAYAPASSPPSRSSFCTAAAIPGARTTT